MVGIDRHIRVVQVDAQTDAPLADICQSTEEGTAQQELLFVKLLVEPGEEIIEDRLGLFLPACVFGLSREAVVANRPLDLVQGDDRVERLTRVDGSMSLAP